MRIIVDRERCTGHGRCEASAPDLFATDDQGFAVVRGDGGIHPEEQDAAELAVDNCPERVIRIVGTS